MPQGSCAGLVLCTMHASTLDEVFEEFEISAIEYVDNHFCIHHLVLTTENFIRNCKY